MWSKDGVSGSSVRCVGSDQAPVPFGKTKNWRHHCTRRRIVLITKTLPCRARRRCRCRSCDMDNVGLLLYPSLPRSRMQAARSATLIWSHKELTMQYPKAARLAATTMALVSSAPSAASAAARFMWSKDGVSGSSSVRCIGSADVEGVAAWRIFDSTDSTALAALAV